MKISLRSKAHKGLAAAALFTVAVGISLSTAYAQSVNCNHPGENLQKRIDAAKAGSELFVIGNEHNNDYRTFDVGDTCRVSPLSLNPEPSKSDP